MEPKWTVLIATCNRCRILEQTVEALTAQRLTGDAPFEILVVDNNSTDGTRAAVEALARNAPVSVRYLHEPRQGKVFAINAGIAAAAAPSIAFIDDDCRPAADWLAAYDRLFDAQPDCAAAGGRVSPIYPDGCPEWIRRHAELLTGPVPRHDYGRENRPYADAMLPFLGGNMAARREALTAVGLFNEARNYVRGEAGRARGGEDTDLFRRMRQAGLAVWYCGGADLAHPIEREKCNLRYLARWQAAHGAKYAEPLAADEPAIAGAPRWLYRRLAGSALGMAAHPLNGTRRLAAYLEFCRAWGMWREYRRRVRAKNPTLPNGS